MKRHLLSACGASALVFALATPAFAQDAPADVNVPPAEQSSTPGTSAAIGSVDEADQAAEQGGADIIVTAQGRAQALADVPLAISAVTAEALANSGANDIRQLNQVAPSLLVSSTGSDSNTSARIRGVGTVGDNAGLESSVAVFIDGVYRSRTGVGLNDLGEIERIEVLRGPQGTLFGRNASAGLLNIVTRGPSFDFGANGEFTYGNYDAYRAQLGITGPITDQLAFRVDGLYSKRDGFYRDVNTGYEANDRDRYLVRGQLLFEPSENFSVRLIGDYSEKNENCCAAVYAGVGIAEANQNLISPANPIVPVLLQVAGVTFEEYFPSLNDPYSRDIAITPGRDYSGTTKDYGGSMQIDAKLGGVSLTSITAYREFSAYQGADADYGLADILNFLPDSGREFKTFSQEVRLQGTAFDERLDWLVGGYFAHENLYTTNSLQFGADYGAFAACRLLTTVSPLLPRNADQPGCLAGPGGAITAGALAGIFPDPDGAGPVQGAAPFVNALRTLSTIANVGDDNANFEQVSDNFAVFTHNIVHLTDRLDLTLGLRYTNETKTLDADFRNTNTVCQTLQSQLLPYLTGAAATTVPATLLGAVPSLGCQGNSSAGLNAITLEDRRRESKFTGTAVLSYKPVDDVLVYASYSRGYKAGGFNLDRSPFLNPPAGGPLPIFPLNPAFADVYASGLQFDEEEVDAFEIGLKYDSRRFSLNLAAFRQEFSNFQLNTFNGTVFVVQNINGCDDDMGGGDRDLSPTTGICDPDAITPGVVSQGVEVEAAFRPARFLTANFGITYADTRFADQLVGSDQGAPLDPQLRLLPGDNMSNAPEIVVTSSIAWTPPIGSTGLTGLVYFDGRLSDDYNTGSDLFPQKEQDSFAVVNGRVGLRGPDQRWAVELWAQNLLNERYSQVTFSSPYQSGGQVAVIAATYPAARYPAGNQIFSSYLAEPRTYGVTLRSRF